MRLNLRAATWAAETWEWSEREKIALQIWQNKIKGSGKTNPFVKYYYKLGINNDV